MRQYFIDDNPVTKEVFKEKVTIALKTWFEDQQKTLFKKFKREAFYHHLEDYLETYYESAGLNNDVAEIVEDGNTVNQELNLYGHTYMYEKVHSNEN